MLNRGINVPENTIAVFIYKDTQGFSNSNLNNVLSKPTKKRDWFMPHFYRCLPLTIGNQYGFVIKTEFEFGFTWDGTDSKEGVVIYLTEPAKNLTGKYPQILTHFGSGIISLNTPFMLRTPPGVNLMTINPPNYILPNITVMTGVVETDNLRRNFSFNLKIQTPNVFTRIPAGTPLAAFIPLPRYYADNFELKLAEELFTKEIIEEELQADIDATNYRNNVEINLPHKVGKHYFNGKDVYGNVFSDHQRR